MTSLPAIVAGASIGIAAGIGSYTFVYARGMSYFTDDPAACANCHVMTEQYDGWLQSSHRAVATCNDCHTPTGLLPKYYVKARNGFWHSFYFTFGGYSEPIQITAGNRRVTEQTCRGCHAAVVDAIDGPAQVWRHRRAAAAVETPCTTCHRSVGHLH
jgi:cytochrome c nitrite reductase small subunit